MNQARPVHGLDLAYPAAQSAIASFHPDAIEMVTKALAQHEVVVIGMAGNPFCKKARVLLSSAQIEHHYWDCGSYFSAWKKRLAIKMWSGWPTFPQVFVKGKLLGGFSELEKAHQSGELQRWIAGSE